MVLVSMRDHTQFNSHALFNDKMATGRPRLEWVRLEMSLFPFLKNDMKGQASALSTLEQNGVKISLVTLSKDHNTPAEPI